MAGDAETIVKVGPGGYPDCDDSKWELKGVSKISRIFISFMEDHLSNRIRSLQFQYIEDGQTKLSPVYGSNLKHFGFKFELVEFNEEGEYITRLSGAALHPYRVTCLSFETNLKKYGPFGSVPAGARSFSFGFGPRNHFAGFFGSSSKSEITSLGCFISPNLI